MEESKHTLSIVPNEILLVIFSFCIDSPYQWGLHRLVCTQFNYCLNPMKGENEGITSDRQIMWRNMCRWAWRNSSNDRSVLKSHIGVVFLKYFDVQLKKTFNWNCAYLKPEYVAVKSSNIHCIDDLMEIHRNEKTNIDFGVSIDQIASIEPTSKIVNLSKDSPSIHDQDTRNHQLISNDMCFPEAVYCNSPFDSFTSFQKIKRYLIEKHQIMTKVHERFTNTEKRTKVFKSFSYLIALLSVISLLLLTMCYLEGLATLDWIFFFAHLCFIGYLGFAGNRLLEWWFVPDIRTSQKTYQRLYFTRLEKLRDATFTAFGLFGSWAYAYMIMERIKLTISKQQPHGWTILFLPLILISIFVTYDIWRASGVLNVLSSMSWNSVKRFFKRHSISSPRFINSITLPTFTTTLIWVCLWLDEVVPAVNLITIVIGPSIVIFFLQITTIVEQTRRYAMGLAQWDNTLFFEKMMELGTVWLLIGLGLEIERKIFAVLPLGLLMIFILIFNVYNEIKDKD